MVRFDDGITGEIRPARSPGACGKLDSIKM
jgi:hypothetical protein